MKKIHLVSLLSLTLVLSACFTSNTYVSGKLLMSVQQGMTPNEVRSIFGSEPDLRRFDGGMEEWEYRRYSSTGNTGWSVILIQFADGRVTGMDSFKDRSVEMNVATINSPSPTAVTTIETFPHRSSIHPNRRPGIMLEKEFDDFLSKVRLTVMTIDQKNLIISAMQQHDFTSAQAKELVNQVFMSDDKMEMMIKIYPCVIDKRNFNQVIDLLSYSGDRDKVRKSIGEYPSKK